MSTLITGGAGFIGSHTSLKLLDSGENIIILDSLINSKPSVIGRIKNLCQNNSSDIDRKIKFFKGDIRDKNSIDILLDRKYVFIGKTNSLSLLNKKIAELIIVPSGFVISGFLPVYSTPLACINSPILVIVL